MATLKSLRLRIKSVKSTQKITKAMKMVAAAKLRRAQEQAQAARPYAEKMEGLVGALAHSYEHLDTAPLLLSGRTGVRHLLVVATSDRGLCGAFNSSVTRAAKRWIREHREAGEHVSLYCIGKKAYEHLAPDYKSIVIARKTEVGKGKLGFDAAQAIATEIQSLLENNTTDRCSIVFNRFQSAMTQIVTFQSLVPLMVEKHHESDPVLPYEYEPSEEVILDELLPRNLAVQVYRALLESAASEQGARMTAMDSATRNAGEMIKKLTLVYNRSRQASITKELIEIISGAEAV